MIDKVEVWKRKISSVIRDETSNVVAETLLQAILACVDALRTEMRGNVEGLSGRITTLANEVDGLRQCVTVSPQAVARAGDVHLRISEMRRELVDSIHACEQRLGNLETDRGHLNERMAKLERAMAPSMTIGNLAEFGAMAPSLRDAPSEPSPMRVGGVSGAAVRETTPDLLAGYEDALRERGENLAAENVGLRQDCAAAEAELDRLRALLKSADDEREQPRTIGDVIAYRNAKYWSDEWARMRDERDSLKRQLGHACEETKGHRSALQTALEIKDRYASRLQKLAALSAQWANP